MRDFQCLDWVSPRLLGCSIILLDPLESPLLCTDGTSSSSANPHWEEFGSGKGGGYILNNEAREALMEVFQLRPKSFKAVRG